MTTAAVGGPQTAQATDVLEFAIGGMTCTACAARIERQLNKLDGVTASVSYLTERARVTSPASRRPSEFISVIEAAGYSAELTSDRWSPGDAGRPPAAETERLAVCVLLAAVTIVLAMVPAAQFRGWQWVSLMLAAPVAIWGAWPIHVTAWRGLGHGAATMDTLVSLGVTASFGWSVYALLFGGAGQIGMRMPFALTFGVASGQTIYLEAAAGVTAAVLAGRYLEARAKARSGGAIAALAALSARTVTTVTEDGELTISAAELRPGALFIARPGEKIATDGVVTAGGSDVDASLLSGESAAREVSVGDEVTGGTVNLTGRLVIRATKVGADTTLSQLTRLVTDALASKAQAQRVADKLAGIFVPCVITMAVVTFGFWLGTGLPAASAWSAGIAVLVVACPCALGLATPTALMAAIGRGAELGVLVRSAQALESAGQITAVILDKTGTLTTGLMSVHAVTTSPGCSPSQALALAGSVELCSEHPVGQAIAIAASREARALAPADDFRSTPGQGVRGVVTGRDVLVGRERFLAAAGMTVPDDLAAAAAEAARGGRTAVFAGWDHSARAVFSVGDALRPGAAAALDRIRGLGVHTWIVTGDSEESAGPVGAELGVPARQVIAVAEPAVKAHVVRELKAAGQSVAMVGDGVNDAAALASADLGMAMASGTDAAIGASDLTLTRADPGVIADAIQLARATRAVIRLNLGWAFGYNVIAIPLAALGYLNPLFSGLAMSASSLVVVSTSLLLRRFRPGGSRR